MIAFSLFFSLFCQPRHGHVGDPALGSKKKKMNNTPDGGGPMKPKDSESSIDLVVIAATFPGLTELLPLV